MTLKITSYTEESITVQCEAKCICYVVIIPQLICGLILLVTHSISKNLLQLVA